MMKSFLVLISIMVVKGGFALAGPVQTETLPAQNTGQVSAQQTQQMAETASVAIHGDTNEVAAASPAATTPVTTETAKLAEDQIPLTIDAAKKSNEAGSSGARALMSMVIILIMVGAGFYYVRRYKTSNTINKSNTQIKVISQHYLGPKRSLAIIHVAGESILVGVTDHNISMIKSLSLIDDEVPANLPNTFGQTMQKIEEATTPKVRGSSAATMQTGATSAIELDEEFSFSNVTDSVSKKLKSMRSFS